MIFSLTEDCRSRKGAWIEIVANKLAAASYKSLPQGSVD